MSADDGATRADCKGRTVVWPDQVEGEIVIRDAWRAKTNTGPECLYGDRSYSQTGGPTLDWLTRTRRQNAAKWRALYVSKRIRQDRLRQRGVWTIQIVQVSACGPSSCHPMVRRLQQAKERKGGSNNTKQTSMIGNRRISILKNHESQMYKRDRQRPERESSFRAAPVY